MTFGKFRLRLRLKLIQFYYIRYHRNNDMRLTLFVIAALLFLPVAAFPQKNSHLRPVIFDTDMGPDYDDVGAITLLHGFADSGYITIAATIASTNYEGVAAVLNVLNSYFKRPGIPIGTPKHNGSTLRDWQHWSDSLLVKYPHFIRTNDEVPDAVDVYRKVLSGQPDKSVTIVTVGFFTNLDALLKSGPDQYSKLTGTALVKKKVRQLVSMAGGFPTGKEFNVRIDSAASQYVFTHWPTPILLSGFEIGWKIRTGLPLIQSSAIHNSPVKDVFSMCIPMAESDSLGRMSWDETAVLVAVKGHEDFYSTRKGTMIVHKDGTNEWSDKGNVHAYLVEKVSPAVVQEVINRMIMR
jgi:inosine-uridine nucleoside N-ribohydrolase